MYYSHKCTTLQKLVEYVMTRNIEFATNFCNHYVTLCNLEMRDIHVDSIDLCGFLVPVGVSGE